MRLHLPSLALGAVLGVSLLVTSAATSPASEGTPCPPVETMRADTLRVGALILEDADGQTAGTLYTADGSGVLYLEGPAPAVHVAADGGRSARVSASADDASLILARAPGVFSAVFADAAAFRGRSPVLQLGERGEERVEVNRAEGVVRY